jgi:hypothetical protein
MMASTSMRLLPARSMRVAGPQVLALLPNLSTVLSLIFSTYDKIRGDDLMPQELWTRQD